MAIPLKGEMGKSLVEEDKVELAKNLLSAPRQGVKFVAHRFGSC